MRFFAALVIIMSCVFISKGENTLDEYYQDALIGKSGEELANALKTVIRSHERLMPQFDEYTLWHYFEMTDVHADGTVWDMFSNDKVPFAGNGEIHAVLGYTHMVFPEWAGDILPYNMEISLDLHNIYPCNIDVANAIYNMIVWDVDEVTYNNGALCIGQTDIAGTTVRAYEPNDEYKGDIARAIMYAVVCYGGEFHWQGQSWNLFNDNSYPVFNSLSEAILLAWHEADPVSEKEKTRNDVVYRLQGNRNPFVDYPDLAGHLWGELIDKPFNTDGPGDDEQGYLHSEYSIDDTIWLRSRYVPTGAIWSIDGVLITKDKVSAIDLGRGLHELRFTADNMQGKVMIIIK